MYTTQGTSTVYILTAVFQVNLVAQFSPGILPPSKNLWQQGTQMFHGLDVLPVT